MLKFTPTMSKNYVIRNNLYEKEKVCLKEVDPFFSHFLYDRGVYEHDDVKLFLNPDFDNGRFDPYLLSDMEKVVSRILKAVKDKEKIAIFSDYDADGIPGGVLAHDFFKMIGHTNFKNYIPDRQLDGFGLNKSIIEEIVKDGCTLLITIDCGIADVSEVDFANSLDMDVIITDHHLPGETLPNAYGIIDPKVSPNYPFDGLCGTGVFWKVIEAILMKDRFGILPGKEKWLLDMVGIATLSDMVPLVSENRTLAYFGLFVLRKTKRLGLIKLFKSLKINIKNISEDDITFMIAPRINATSRMGISMDAFRLLTTEDEVLVDELIKKIEHVNNERKGITAHLVKEVRKALEIKYSPYFNNKVIVLGSPSWKPSLLGLVASSLVETESKPVFLWGKEGNGEYLKGSCRGVHGLSVSNIMSKTKLGTFLNFGGHHLAGGFSVSYESIHTLHEEIEKVCIEEDFEIKDQIVYIDKELDLSDLTYSLLQKIENLAPFGVGNEKPLFKICDVLIQDISFFGKEKNHLKLILGGVGIPEAISFFVSPQIQKKVEKGKKIDIIGNLEKNYFGRSGLRIRIVDII